MLALSCCNPCAQLHTTQVPKHDRHEVRAFCYEHGTTNILGVRWDGTKYLLESASGYSRESTVTDCEDVS